MARHSGGIVHWCIFHRPFHYRVDRIGCRLRRNQNRIFGRIGAEKCSLVRNVLIFDAGGKAKTQRKCRPYVCGNHSRQHFRCTRSNGRLSIRDILWGYVFRINNEKRTRYVQMRNLCYLRRFSSSSIPRFLPNRFSILDYNIFEVRAPLTFLTNISVFDVFLTWFFGVLH